jgi:glycosyltransferase involved in cell wall biosynthesis
MEGKRILWLCSWYPSPVEPFNGDFIQRHAKAAALLNDIHVIHVIGDNKKVVANYMDEKICQSGRLTEQIITFSKSTTLPGRLIANYRLLILFRKAVKKYIAEKGVPDLVHVHIPMKAGLAGLWIKKKYNIPYIVTEHWGIYNGLVEESFINKSAFVKQCTKKIISNAAGFLSVSNYLAEGINQMVTKKTFSVIPNAVDTDYFFYDANHSERFRFIHVSNMVPLKNVAGILRAFKRLNEENKNAELVMVGDNSSSFKNLAGKLGLLNESVFFRGEISYPDVAKEMQSAQALVLFSNMENSPCVIGEALCCGLPVIVTNVGGIPELINNENALTVLALDENALTTAMQKMMTQYKNYNLKKIADDASAKFSYPVIASQFDKIYRKIISPHKK